jgi:hypothetical protein
MPDVASTDKWHVRAEISTPCQRVPAARRYFPSPTTRDGRADICDCDSCGPNHCMLTCALDADAGTTEEVNARSEGHRRRAYVGSEG